MRPTPRRLPLALLLTRLALVRAFRQSGLGPLWNTVGVALAVLIVGLLFGTILRRQLLSFESYVTVLASGLVMWTFLSSVLSETSIAFVRWMPVLRHSPISLEVIALSILLRHLTVLALNLLLLLALQFALLGAAPDVPSLGAALLLLIANAAWMGMATLLLGIRFRNMGQMVGNLLQFAFLLTPILWPPYFLGRFDYLLALNPFHHLLSVFNAATSGESAAASSWLVGILMAVMGGVGTTTFHLWSRRRWPYWI